MKVIIVGHGYMGQIRRRVVESLDQLELCAICDPVLLAGGGPEYPVYGDYREAITAVSPDIVFVCAPNNINPVATTYALEHGCHVFCEKPPGRNVCDVQRIIEAERAHPELKLVFGFNHRHHPGIVDAKALVDSGSLGAIHWLRGVYGKSGGSDFESSWRNDPEVGGGGILLDQGIHMLDLFRFFCGDFEEVVGMRTTSFWNVPAEDNAFVLLRAEQIF